nr:actin assembly-inducing protein ActA [Listeria ivanovii]
MDRFLRAMMAVCFTASCILVNPGVIFANNSTVSTSSNENSSLESDEQEEGEQTARSAEAGRSSPRHKPISKACARDIQELDRTGKAKSVNVSDSMTTPDGESGEEPGQKIGAAATKPKPPSVRKRLKHFVKKVLKGKQSKSSKEGSKTTKNKQESSEVQSEEPMPHPSIANQPLWRRLSDKIKPLVTSDDDKDSRGDSDEWDDGEEAKEKVEEGGTNLAQDLISEARERDVQEVEKMGKVKNADVTALLAMLDSKVGKVPKQDIKETLNDEFSTVLLRPKRSIKEMLSNKQNRLSMNSSNLIKNRRKAIEASDVEDTDTEEKPTSRGAIGPFRTMNPLISEEIAEEIQTNKNNQESNGQRQFGLLPSSTEGDLRFAFPEKKPRLLRFNTQNNESESSVSEPTSFNLPSPPTEKELAAMGIKRSISMSVEEAPSLLPPREDVPQSLTSNPSLDLPSPPTEKELAAMGIKRSINPLFKGKSSLLPSREDTPQSLTVNQPSELPSPPTRAELAAMGIFMFDDEILRGDLGNVGDALERHSSRCLASPAFSYFCGLSPADADDEYSESEDELDGLLNPKVRATSQQFRKVGFMPFSPLREQLFADGNKTLTEEQVIKDPLEKTKQEQKLLESIGQRLTLVKAVPNNTGKVAKTTEASRNNKTIKTTIITKNKPSEALSLLTKSAQTAGSILKASSGKIESQQKNAGSLKPENPSLISAGIPIIPLGGLEEKKEQPKKNVVKGTLKNNELVEKSEDKDTPSRSGSKKLIAKSAESEKANQEVGNNMTLVNALVAIGIISLIVITKIIRTRKSN